MAKKSKGVKFEVVDVGKERWVAVLWRDASPSDRYRVIVAEPGWGEVGHPEDSAEERETYLKRLGVPIEGFDLSMTWDGELLWAEDCGGPNPTKRQFDRLYAEGKLNWHPLPSSTMVSYRVA